MKNPVIRLTQTTLLATFFLLALPQAEAACERARAILSATRTSSSYLFTPGNPFAPAAEYPLTAGGGTTTYFLQGVFWSFGSGNPLEGVGNDSGAFIGEYPHDGPSWLMPSYHGGPSAFIGGGYGHWQFPGVDGCIDRDGSNRAGPDEDECLVVLLTDQGKEADGYFALITAPPSKGGDFMINPAGGFPKRIDLAPIPDPVIFKSESRGKGKLAVSATVEPGKLEPERGFYLQCHADEILSGYRLYVRSLPAGTPPPVQFNSQAARPRWRPDLPPWKPITEKEIPVGQTADVVIECEPGADLYLCATLTFGGVGVDAENYELDNCSANSQMLSCPKG